QSYVKETFGISPQKQKKVMQSSQGGGVASIVTSFLGSFTTIMANSLLTLVYLFMLLYYRDRFTKFILKLVPGHQKEEAQRVISDSSRVAQQYLVGRGLLIVSLAVLYSIGLTLVGLQNAI